MNILPSFIRKKVIIFTTIVLKEQPISYVGHIEEFDDEFIKFRFENGNLFYINRSHILGIRVVNE